jgi:DNA-binding response OmpR family regulator
MIDILLVADVSWIVNDVRAALSDGNHSVDVVADPRAVAKATAERRPDLLMVDLQVGSMGGMAVARAVRDAAATGDGERPPIILLLDRDADSFLAGRSGADGWVRKPFSSDDLRGAVAAALATTPAS